MVKRKEVKYKKAPQAPRRFKSSYMFFSTEKHKAIRKELTEKGGETEKTATTEVAKMVSQAWKTLSIDEREVWEEMARRDKARYEVEKKFYNGPWKVLATKRTQKDPNAPKRPMSAFLAFSNLKRAEVKEDNPGLGNSERSRVLAKMWKEAPEDERKNYIDKEYKLRQTYKTAIAEWRRNSEGVMQAARKEREDEALRTVLGTADKGGPRLSSKDGGKISPHSAIIEPHPLEPNDGRHSHHHQHHFQYAQQHPHPNTAPPSMPLIEENRDSFHGQQHQHYPSYTSSGLQGSSYPQDPSAHGKSNGNDPDAAPPAGETQIEGSAVPYQPPPTVDSYYHQHGGNVPTYYYGAGEKGGPSSGGGDYNYGYGQPYYPQHGGDGHDYYQQHPHLPYDYSPPPPGAGGYYYGGSNARYAHHDDSNYAPSSYGVAAASSSAAAGGVAAAQGSPVKSYYSYAGAAF